jgi:hypothetical protein
MVERAILPLTMMPFWISPPPGGEGFLMLMGPEAVAEPGATNHRYLCLPIPDIGLQGHLESLVSLLHIV